MCGITGIYAFSEHGKRYFKHIESATDVLERRGPDSRGTFADDNVALGHRRLSVIDTSMRGAQPMVDATKRYVIVYNGEIYNFKNLRNDLKKAGISFTSDTDTEVLLQLFIHEGVSFLQRLNGFFAFAIYDKQKNDLLIARDRFGIKPLLVYQDQDKLIFASELKSIFAYGIEKKIDKTALLHYLQLNYTPGPISLIEGVSKVMPGTYAYVNQREVRSQYFYTALSPGRPVPRFEGSYQEAQQTLVALMEQSVSDRLVSDVPIGTFLSGGIDSSVVTALAARHTNQLHTFSIGYPEEPYYDETRYAELVSKKYGTRHTTFQLKTSDLFDGLQDTLDYFDEPFADSSSLAVNLLSKLTREHITVALSGDGADELFSGYQKHTGEYRIRHAGMLEKLICRMGPLWKKLPRSRNNPFSNRIRQFDRFASTMRLNVKDRYWKLATYANEKESLALLCSHFASDLDLEAYNESKSNLLCRLIPEGSFNDFLDTDMSLVLPYDMLVKVDLMSMNNSLEVRVPFLDHRVVAFVRSLPVAYKINKREKKRILQDAFRSILPAELYHRPKHGFEVPLLMWLRHDLDDLLRYDLLEPKFIEQQKIFNPSTVSMLMNQLHSTNPGDAPARIWGLLVFQWWWRRYIGS